MSDLFPTTPQELPALERARKVYAEALAAYGADPDNGALWAKQEFAYDELEDLEQAELQQLRK